MSLRKTPTFRRPVRLGRQCDAVLRLLTPIFFSPSYIYTQIPKGMAYLSLMAAPCLDDFVILRGLGDGSSGSVHLVRERETGGLYALKAIRKRKRCGMEVGIEPVMTERNTLLDFRGNDFILQLRACFHDSRNYYLVTVSDAIVYEYYVFFGMVVLTSSHRSITLLETSTLFYC